ncbi:hypothetical protein BC939DRAFT_202429 [Gamsiella multidivaricata]|uniref:uncharacterized protein n=1 Tax=Gamsiella multidivaricata TaxID=101098 RepID=UPI00221FE21A|nr:uncharacterized protein BC939DRAFT_202429 [Gamsiella multidivaricata]KAI7821735.1 hypothetical protein BC939DRAFT_202429 [Gamsiella multidivaricata]
MKKMNICRQDASEATGMERRKLRMEMEMKMKMKMELLLMLAPFEMVQRRVLDQWRRSKKEQCEIQRHRRRRQRRQRRHGNQKQEKEHYGLWRRRRRRPGLERRFGREREQGRFVYGSRSIDVFQQKHTDQIKAAVAVSIINEIKKAKSTAGCRHGPENAAQEHEEDGGGKKKRRREEKRKNVHCRSSWER